MFFHQISAYGRNLMIFSDLSFIINTDSVVKSPLLRHSRVGGNDESLVKYSIYEAIYTDNLLKTLILMSMYVDLYLGNLL